MKKNYWVKLWWLTVPVITVASGIGWGWDGLEWVLLYIPFVVIIELIFYFKGTTSIFDFLRK